MIHYVQIVRVKKPGNTKTFVKLFNLSMNQFFLDLPLDDRVKGSKKLFKCNESWNCIWF